MKENTHPHYLEVVFEDSSCGTRFVIPSTIQTDKTLDLDGKSYPYVKVDVSSESHPVYTGKQTYHHTADQVGKFQQKFGRLTGALPGTNPTA